MWIDRGDRLASGLFLCFELHRDQLTVAIGFLLFLLTRTPPNMFEPVWYLQVGM